MLTPLRCYLLVSVVVIWLELQASSQAQPLWASRSQVRVCQHTWEQLAMDLGPEHWLSISALFRHFPLSAGAGLKALECDACAACSSDLHSSKTAAARQGQTKFHYGITWFPTDLLQVQVPAPVSGTSLYTVPWLPAGQLQSTITCSACRAESHCFDLFLDLSVPLPQPRGLRRSHGHAVSIEVGCISLCCARSHA